MITRDDIEDVKQLSHELWDFFEEKTENSSMDLIFSVLLTVTMQMFASGNCCQSQVVFYKKIFNEAIDEIIQELTDHHNN